MHTTQAAPKDLRTPVIPYASSSLERTKGESIRPPPSRRRLNLSSREPAPHPNRDLFTRVIELLVKNRALGKMIGAPLLRPFPFPSRTIQPPLAHSPPTPESCRCEWLKLFVGIYFILFFHLQSERMREGWEAGFRWVMGEEKNKNHLCSSIRKFTRN